MKKIILLTEKSVKAIFTGMFIFILLDVMLPKLDGLEITKRLRQRNKQILMIFYGI